MQIQGTPGRLNDFVEGKEVSLSNVSKLVVDEADRMLDMGLLELVSEGVSKIRDTFSGVPVERTIVFLRLYGLERVCQILHVPPG